jgi:hypothetical protein
MSTKKSIYEEFVLESNDRKRSVDITTGVISVDYYEDVFSPTITAKIKVVNTGNTVVQEGGTESNQFIMVSHFVVVREYLSKLQETLKKILD